QHHTTARRILLRAPWRGLVISCPAAAAAFAKSGFPPPIPGEPAGRPRSTLTLRHRNDPAHKPIRHDMNLKASNAIKALLAGSSLAMALLLAAPWTVQAQERGAEKLIQLKPIKTAHDIEALQPGDMVVMTCPKCKTVTATYVETIKGQIKEEKMKTEHLCPGCETKIETTGTGKSAKQEVTHVCKKCGSKDVLCCVMKKGSAPTKGMEEHK